MYISCFVVSALLSYGCFIKASLIVQTKNGLVLGREAQTVPGNKTYHAFQGIPFAQPPIGPLRFANPLPAKNWSGTLNATQDGNICPQSFTQGSEDCLFINVYTTNFDPRKKLPVMVWIYGGGFVGGDSTYAQYGPDYLLDEDVIVVSFNYRLGIFGFLSTEDSSCSGNWGFKDQILALKWTQDNIANFGGDVKMVTIFGQSAGSASVSYLCQTNLTKGLFHKAIMESGTSLDIWSLTRTPRASAFATGKLFGIFTTNSTELVRRLRQVDATQLNIIGTTQILNQFLVTDPLDGFYFGPSIEPPSESAVIVEKSHQLLENGGFHKIPYVIGFTSQESLAFTTIILWLNAYLLANGLYPTRLIPLDMNTNLNAFYKGTLALGIKRHYFDLLPPTLSQEAIAQYLTDVEFVNGIHETIRLTSISAKVYCYRFSYEGGPLGNSSQRSGPGVGHAEELFYLWRHQASTYVPTASDLLTRQRLVKSWTNFAKTSNPTPTLNPVFENVTWTATSSQNVNCLDIGNHLAMDNNFTQYSTTYWNDLYARWGNQPFDTY